MEPLEVLERAARYYGTLKLLSFDRCDYSFIQGILGKKYSSVDNIINKLGKAGLVEVEKKPATRTGRGKKYVKLSELGMEYLDLIEKYNQYFSNIGPDEKIAARLDKIIQNIQKYEDEEKIREPYINELRNLCRTNLKSVHYPGLWVFFKNHLEKKELQSGIDDCLLVSIKNMLAHKNSKKYLDEILLPLVKVQLLDKMIDINVRMTRAAFLWEVYENDFRNDEIFKFLIDLFKDECINNGSDLCSWIKSNLRGEPKDQLMDKLLKLELEVDIINKLR